MITAHKFRSQPHVNTGYDMIRVKIDMTLREWRELRKHLNRGKKSNYCPCCGDPMCKNYALSNSGE